MTEDAVDTFTQESSARLIRAEQAGLRLALACRTVITGAGCLWYAVSVFFFPEISARVETVLVLFGFTALGALHYAVIGTTYDRRWIKFAIYGLDALAICATFALVPINVSGDVPQIMAFRSYGIYYLFPLLAMACLSLSWRLVLWTGAMIMLGWWLAFLWVVSEMDTVLSWSDMPAGATAADYERIFLSLDFIGRGNRIEETAMVFFATLALAGAVYRARGVFFAQVAADIEKERERLLRKRVSNVLGKHVPEAIAERLIADDTPLLPQRRYGTALVMDIAGFTAFSTQHEPEFVVEALDKLLSDATRTVSKHGGVVLTYLGDGFLATFNAPAGIDNPEDASLATARDLLSVATAHGFDIRLGVATGDLVTGIIGSETRQSFTVYGNAVNLASRLEQLGKKLGRAVVLDEKTQTAASTDWQLEDLGHQSIPGIHDPVLVHSFSNI
ncbi:MAG: adenylate/guanylate cyclase domain-containing protein [Pseudomonadota bacterium]